MFLGKIFLGGIYNLSKGSYDDIEGINFPYNMIYGG